MSKELEDLLIRYEINSLYELELRICGFSKNDIDFFLDCENYKVNVVAKKYGVTRQAVWQRHRNLKNRLKKTLKL